MRLNSILKTFEKNLPKNLPKNLKEFLNSNPEYNLDLNFSKFNYFVLIKSNDYFYHSNNILNTLVELKHNIDKDYISYKEDFDHEVLMYKKYYDELTYKDMKSTVLDLNTYINTSEWDIIGLNTIQDVKDFFKKTTIYKNEIQECWECKKFFNNYTNFRCLDCVCPDGFSESGC